MDGRILRTHRKTSRRFGPIQQSRALLTVFANLYAGNFKISRTPRSPKVELVLLLGISWRLLRGTKNRDGYCTVDAAGTMPIGFLEGAVASRKECMDLCTARSECIGVTSTQTNCRLAARNCDALAVSGGGGWCCWWQWCCRYCRCYFLSHSLSLTF